MATGKIQNRTIVGQQLDHAIDSLLAENRTDAVERAHLERFQSPARDEDGIDWTGPFMSSGGLARELDDRLMPRLRDPSVLERARFVSILRSVGDGLDQAVAGEDAPRLSQVARNVVRREIERSLKLQARIGELVEG